MSFDFPVTVQQDIQQYAQSEHISAEEAALKIVRFGLRAIRRKTSKGELTEAEWQKVQEADPGFAFFATLPDSVIDNIAEASRQTRAEKFTSRG